MKLKPLATAVALVCVPVQMVFACATCGCSLSSDAAMGYSAEPGWRVSLQYDYINQDQLRSGTSRVSASQPASIANQEVESYTKNQYLTLGVAYSPNQDWNFKLLVPYIDRSHATYGSTDTPPLSLTADNLSGTKVSSLGDIKVISSYQGFLPTHNLGVQFGVKLPTGNYGSAPDGGATVGRNPVNFNSGPNAGSPLDASLQAGTGSMDLIIGAYYYQPISQNFDAFINGQFQFAVHEALNQAGADYRPGDLTSLSFGVRYEADPKMIPQLQVNVTHRSHDMGALADTTDTAGTVTYLSPGVTVSVAPKAQVYGFLQLPVHSNLDGYQLFPHWTASIGASFGF